MDDRTAEAVALAVGVVTTPPRFMDGPRRLEASFIELAQDLPGYEDFETARASFYPGEGDLLDARGLKPAAREFLPDLGHHSLCLHDLRLGKRP